MAKLTNFQHLIATQLHLGRTNANGWRNCKCQICVDKEGQHTENAGILFTVDGGIIYKCWSAKCQPYSLTSYLPTEHLSWRFKNFLTAFGVQIPPEMMVELMSMVLDRPIEKINYEIFQPHRWQPLQLPTNFIPYDPTVHSRAAAYLQKREMYDLDYFVDTSGVWLYIPLRHYRSFVGYQKVFLPEKKYFKIGNSHLMYLPNGNVPETPIIVEGIIDAKSIPFGVAVLQSSVSARQAYFLRKCKQVYLLPDKNATGFLQTAKKYGWKVIVPKYQEKDSNKAMLKYGRLVLAEMLRERICETLGEAELRYKLWSAG